MTERFYTGIGSRVTPAPILSLMTKLAQRLSLEGIRLRSGGAQGADTAFKQGADRMLADIYLPWPGFAENGICDYDSTQIRRAQQYLARPYVYPKFTPAMLTSRKARGPLMLHTRNVFQVLGLDLQTPSDIVFCWTPEGEVSHSQYHSEKTGGTGTAINIASLNNIPVCNLQIPAHRLVAEQFIRGELAFDQLIQTVSNINKTVIAQPQRDAHKGTNLELEL